MKRILAMTLAVLLLAGLVSTGTAQSGTTGRVFGGWLILRASPSFTGQIRSSYPSGTVVGITGQSGEWYQVVAPDGLTGYMYGKYLKVSGTPVPTYKTAYVTSPNGLNVRLRSGPGTGYSILASYAPGTKCTIINAGSNWCMIQIGSYTGYMMTKYLTSAEPGPTPPTPTSEPGPETKAWVTSRNGKGVNLRSGPGKEYTSIGFYSVGTSAAILYPGPVWSYIRIGTRHGYMMTEFLTTNPINPDPPPVIGGAYVTSANGKSVNLRTGPGKQYRAIASFKVGTHLEIITRGVDWYYIKIGNYYGYMMKQFIFESVSPNTPLPPTNQAPPEQTTAPTPAPTSAPTSAPTPEPTPTPVPATQTDI